MSLNSFGQHFQMEIPSMTKVDTVTCKPVALPSVTFYQFTDSNQEKDKRQAFLKLMEEFSNSENFKTMFYNLQNEVVLKVEHLVYTGL